MAVPEFKPPGEVPAGPLQWLREWIVQAALWKQTRDPANTTVGSPLDKFLTRKELLDIGVIAQSPGGSFTAGAGGGGGGGGGTVIITPPPTAPYTPDLTPPPTPEGLTVSPGFTTLILQWTPPTYTQGRGHARTLIYGAVWLEGDPAPVFADAQLVDSASGTNIHSFATGPSKRWAIWIKWQSVDGAISVNPAGGANGVVATTGVDIANVIAALTAAAMNPATPYGVFTLRGDLINVADNSGVATNLFNVVTTPISVGGFTVGPGVYMQQAYIHNGFITNAMIGRAVIDDATVSTLSAAKFTGGEMRVDSFLQSTNYTGGPSGLGFKISADGTAELQAAYIRGQLTASQINSNGLSIRDGSGNIILNAGATPSIGGGVVVTGTGGATLGALATGFVATPIVTITGTGVIFVTPSGSLTPAPATHTLTANVQNINTPVYQWLVDGVVQASTTNTLVVPSFVAGGASKLVRVNVQESGDPTKNGFDVVSVYSLQEGSDAYSAGLTDQNMVVAAAADGTVGPGQLPLSSQFVVARGATFLTSGVTYSVVSSSGLSGVTINASTGVIAIAGVTADRGTATFRAVVTSGPTIDRPLSVTKAKEGPAGTTPGPAGLRGSITGYSNSVSPNILSTNPWNGSVDNDQATILIWKMLGNAGTPPLGPTFEAHLRIGDTVTLRNAANTLSATRIWGGTAWLDPGVVITGNLIVGGTIAAGTNLNTAGYVRVEGGIGYTLPTPTTGTPLSRTAASVANTSASQDFGVVGMTSQSGIGAGVYGVNLSNTLGVGVYGRGPTGVYGVASTAGGNGVFGTSTGGVAIYGQSVTSIGVRGESNSSTGVSGVSVTASGVFGSSSSGSGVVGSASSGTGGYFTGATALAAQGPVKLEGTDSTLRFKPNAFSPAGVGVVMRTDGGSFLLGFTSSGNADGSPSRNGLVYNLTTGQMLIENLGQYGMTINAGSGPGYGLATFTGTKPGPGSTVEWERVEINGRVGRRPVWFDDGPPP